MMDKQAARERVTYLTARYVQLSQDERKSLGDKDAQRQFILPLFHGLGWDITGTSGEVRRVIGSGSWRPDFELRSEGDGHLLLLARSASTGSKNPEIAAQAVSFAYNRQAPWVVMCDFESLQVYSTELAGERVADCRILNLRYDEYLERFDELWTLSLPAIQQGSLSALVRANFHSVARRLPVEDQILTHLVRWREDLLRFFWRHNRERSSSLAHTDEAIQRLFDRLIFIRTCEDRRVEKPRLSPLLDGRRKGHLERDLWSALLELFRDLNSIYNTHLFERHLLDILTCEEAPFFDILEGLYFSVGPVHYQFDVIPTQLLGRVYEQYLGLVSETALLGFEPEIDQVIKMVSRRHSYRRYSIGFTPQFVVDFLLEQTLGQLVQMVSPYEVGDLTILDLACGAGSFLITACERLIQYQAQALHQPDLSQPQRLETLKKNIYGADLDIQAVEATQLCLLLEALEVPGPLPNLNSNIKLGNSLIEGRADELAPVFGENWEALAQPINWVRALPRVMGRGGFDVIVGNPPYIPDYGLAAADREYYESLYSSAIGEFDTSALFVERGWQLLRPAGIAGFILPRSILTEEQGKGLRSVLSSENAIWQIVDFGEAQVLKGAKIATCLVIVRKVPNPQFQFAQAESLVQAGHGLSGDQLDWSVRDAAELGEGAWLES